MIANGLKPSNHERRKQMVSDAGNDEKLSIQAQMLVQLCSAYISQIKLS
jgi:hypothetical protein